MFRQGESEFMTHPMYKKRRTWKSVVLGAAAIATCTSAIGQPAQAQRVQSPLLSIFENVTLSPRFSPDPLTIRGISGGSVSAKEIAGRVDTATGPCIGFTDARPDHTLVLTNFFSYLNLQVQSPEDTTLIIRGPGGSWCNDDAEGKNPGIAGEWLAGKYEIWIGSYKPNSYHPYLIRLTEVR